MSEKNEKSFFYFLISNQIKTFNLKRKRESNLDFNSLGVGVKVITNLQNVG